MAKKTPQISWYQRKNTVHLSLCINTSLVSDILLEINDNSKLILQYPRENPLYSLELNTFEAVESEITSQLLNERLIQFVLTKKESNSWTRLTKHKNEYSNHIQVDWSNWIDDDEEDEENPQNLDFASMMQNMDPNMMRQLSQMQMGQGGANNGMTEGGQDSECQDGQDSECQDSECQDSECQDSECQDSECQDSQDGQDSIDS
jgi:hypothetical protein